MFTIKFSVLILVFHTVSGGFEVDETPTQNGDHGDFDTGGGGGKPRGGGVPTDEDTDHHPTPEEILSSHPDSYVLSDPHDGGNGATPSFSFEKEVELPIHLVKENEITRLKVHQMLNEHKDRQKLVEESVKKLQDSFGYGTFGYDGYKNTFSYEPIDLGTHQAIDLGTTIDFNGVKDDDGKLKLPIQTVTVTKTVGVHVPQPYPYPVKQHVPIHIPSPVPIPVPVAYNHPGYSPDQYQQLGDDESGHHQGTDVISITTDHPSSADYGVGQQEHEQQSSDHSFSAQPARTYYLGTITEEVNRHDHAQERTFEDHDSSANDQTKVLLPLMVRHDGVRFVVSPVRTMDHAQRRIFVDPVSGETKESLRKRQALKVQEPYYGYRIKSSGQIYGSVPFNPR